MTRFLTKLDKIVYNKYEKRILIIRQADLPPTADRTSVQTVT